MAFLRSTSGRVRTNQDGCLASPRLATILDALTVFCPERASVDNRDVPVSLRLDKLNVIVSGRCCHNVHKTTLEREGRLDAKRESSIGTQQLKEMERVLFMFTRRNISKKTKTKSLKELFGEDWGELSAGELSSTPL